MSLLSIRKQEEGRDYRPDDTQPDFFREMKEGIQIVVHNPILRRLAACAATSNLGTNMVGAVVVIFAFDYLHLSTVEWGLVGTISSVGFVLGVLVSGRITARFGVGISLAISISSAFIIMATPLAQYGYPFLVLSGIGFFAAIIVPTYNINAVSLRQVITPNRLQGRMNATMRTIIWGTIPVGSIAGGILGSTIGIVNTLYLGAFLAGLAVIWIISGPVVKIRTQPEPEEA
jgi:MFS family permease